jgi:hypothetical protein
MGNEPLHREVETSAEPAELVKLRRTIGALQVVHFVLFGASLVLLVVNFGHTKSSEQNLWWAITLGGAVVARVVRTSFVNKHNRLLTGGRPAPLS